MTSADPRFQAAISSHRAGRLDEAASLYRAILAVQPNHTGALHLLGVVAVQTGDFGLAVELITRAIELSPGKAVSHNNLGTALRGSGRLEEALAAFEQAVALQPAYADALSNLGSANHALGNFSEGRKQLARAISLEPNHVDAIYNFANLLRDEGSSQEAVHWYQRAASLAPHRPDLQNNLANALFADERPLEAEKAYQRALTLDPQFAEAYLNLATVCGAQEENVRATEACRLAASLRPANDLWQLRKELFWPVVYSSEAEIDEVVSRLDQTLTRFESDGIRFEREDLVASGIFPPFGLAYQGRETLGIKRRFARLFVEGFREEPLRPHPVGPPRIGFVVTAGHEGIFIRCLAGIIDRLTPGRFKPIIFAATSGVAKLSTTVRHPDVSIVPLPHGLSKAIEAIRETRCHLIYHWEVGTDPLNYFLPFGRLAPRQCTSWGTHVTSGVPMIDSYLSSRLIEASDDGCHASEAVVRFETLPTFQRRLPAGQTNGRESFGLPANRQLYVCPQTLFKLHPSLDMLFAGILDRDPRGVIVVKEGRWPRPTAVLRQRFARTLSGFLDRVIFVPWQSHSDYLSLLQLADVILDTRPFGAGSTSYDFFSAGAPVVTWPGESNVGRYTWACYLKMGCTDLVAHSPEQYVELAVRVANDRSYRAQLCRRISQASQLLFEDKRVIAEHEAYFEMQIQAVEASPS